MQSNTSVTHLDLSDCGLETEGGVAITAMFKENCYITHLVYLCLAVQKFSTYLKRHCPYYWPFQESFMISHFPQDLSDNHLLPAGAFAVAGIIEYNNTLSHLSLRGKTHTHT